MTTPGRGGCSTYRNCGTSSVEEVIIADMPVSRVGCVDVDNRDTDVVINRKNKDTMACEGLILEQMLYKLLLTASTLLSQITKK